MNIRYFYRTETPMDRPSAEELQNKRMIKKVHSKEYDADGVLFLLPDDQYYIELNTCAAKIGKITIGRRVEADLAHLPSEREDFSEIEDWIGMVKLEDLYTDYMLGLLDPETVEITDETGKELTIEEAEPEIWH